MGAGERLAAAAARAQNAVVELGEAYAVMVSAIVELSRQAYRDGGTAGVEDVTIRAGRDIMDAELLGLLVGCGLGQVLILSGGRADARPVRDFAHRWTRRVEHGALTTSRGSDAPATKRPFPPGIGVEPPKPINWEHT